MCGVCVCVYVTEKDCKRKRGCESERVHARGERERIAWSSNPSRGRPRQHDIFYRCTRLMAIRWQTPNLIVVVCHEFLCVYVCVHARVRVHEHTRTHMCTTLVRVMLLPRLCNDMCVYMSVCVYMCTNYLHIYRTHSACVIERTYFFISYFHLTDHLRLS